MTRKIVLYIMLWSLLQFALIVLLWSLFTHPVFLVVSAIFAFITALGIWLLLEGIEEVDKDICEDIYERIEGFYDTEED